MIDPSNTIMKLFIALFVTLAVALTATDAASPKTVTTYMSFYAAGDNCPPGPAIAYPRKSGGVAGGLGTYANPITFAGAKASIPTKSIIYSPTYKKYLIMEDSCEECINKWNSQKKYHVDVWLGPSTIAKGTTDCEVALTLGSTSIILNPFSNYTVDTTPFFANGACIKPVTKCVDDGNECGNLCEIPNAASCTQLAQMFLLTNTRFAQLNPDLNCGRTIPADTSVCMSGSCGGP
ncbi:hypothetical protein SAMD00019534_105860 [Acytostelium subglobosum LB1]|uniref:hypothetical protein n=1 Tax=Acytostelium subglobosum LB1 TaxID=1410327 RepID=UPI000644E138|nr:hypothetical protein SAMD00019534_105860 [Acytostelium subglobosum LB1]GAM27410.1 hypothetical protein SAMD00019534_105860 [Acytostelium subglobosum LB1]|eukprot:XP_012749475.1 hypothetical protein SAMD00019534_105860 [Acytostelium subglobosum LB1]